ncbi:MAG: inorganic phosphate transporter [bacterium]|nr:inorganic phosphate transporter [bacterium]
MLSLLPGLYLGWGIGANDTANAFGPQVGANIVTLRRAAVLTAAFGLLGAVVEGQKIFPALGGFTHLSLEMSVVAVLSTAIVVNVMTRLGLPISTSHAIVGALIGVGFAERAGFNIPIVMKVATSMLATPVGAATIAYLIYRALAALAAGRLGSALFFHLSVRYAAVVIGCYAAYAMGANNVGNAMAPYVAVGVIGASSGAALGGAAIALGVLTYSHRVIMVVGKQITALDPISALVATTATAITVHLFTQLGIPVSTSQAIVGAVVGVGLTKGIMGVNRRTLMVIPAGWVISVAGSGAAAWLFIMAYRMIQ